jgi:hypothetical protein
MKRWSWLVVLLVVFAAGTVWAKGYTVQKKAGDYALEITMDKNPPVVGANHVEVVVTASMPAMPGMPAMENKGDAKAEGGKYKAKVDLSMGGSWNMSVRITQGGKTATAKWTVDVR